MPPKRKLSLGRLTPNAKRLQESKGKETEDMNGVRLERQAERQQQLRQHEGEERREERLASKNERQQQLRQHEDEERREERLASQNERQQQLRQHEGEERREERLLIEAGRQQRRRSNKTSQLALKYNKAAPPTHSVIGPMEDTCVVCHAKRFKGEAKGLCCSSGKVALPPFPALPDFLKELLSGEGPLSKHFLSQIRRYNGSFAMTSFGHKEAALQGWNPSFRIQGQVFHRIGSLLPPPEGQAKFLQVYFIDSHDKELEARQHDNLNPSIVEKLTNWFHDNNQLVRQLKTAADAVVEEGSCEERRLVIREDKRPRGEHQRRYNAQAAPEVGILMDNDVAEARDVVLRFRDGAGGGLKRISELHPSYDALQYPLMFPYGNDGYTIYLMTEGERKVTQLQYYSYHIMVREGNDILMMGRLFQQFLVDVYCKIETERLGWIRREQKTLRADDYGTLRDSLVASDGDPRNVGQRVVLPSTYTGGPRWMHERQSDAMAYVRRMGRPELFITVTTNPKWPEIRDNLLPGQEPQDRPDVIARVFRQKLKRLMELLKNGAFGEMQAFVYTVEYQKRGLPHAHILQWLTPQNRIKPDDIDLAITAEIPNKENDPELHNMVMAHMIHGPCGHLNPNCPCMKDQKCSKSFPKPFLQSTEQGMDSYPKYRRLKPEDGGHTGEILMRQHGRQVVQVVTNQWVVPYNPFLLRQFNCHINVEICSSIKSIKYICKYLTKGADQAVFELQRMGNGDEERGNRQVDEVAHFQNARYVGSAEAAWRILEHPISEHFPPVMGLAVHLENGQRVYFNEDNAVETAHRPPPATTLTAFFDLCSNDDFAKTLKYHEVPEYYTWNKSSKKWVRRKRGEMVQGQHAAMKAPAIGRIFGVSPRQTECYYVRLLLNEVCGPTSFSALRTVDGQEMSFREACLARGLLENDQHLIQAMEEAGNSQSAPHLRSLLAIIITACFPSNPCTLWQQFRDLLSEDYLFQHRRNVNNPEAGFTEDVYNLALCSLEDKVIMMGGGPLTSYDLPAPERGTEERLEREYFREVDYDHEQLAVEAQDLEQHLTDDQRAIYNAFLAMVQQGPIGEGDRSSNIIFLDAPGGTGKSYVMNAILKKIRSGSKIALATASSGIAATLLQGGRTLHSTFKVPLDTHLKEQPTCNLKRGTAMANVIKNAAAIIVDEAPMSHKSVFEAVDRSLQDVTEVKRPMGGIPTLLCGDFRQVLPVVKGGTRANTVNATIKTSHLWRHVTVMHLTTNMRAHLSGDEGAAQFSKLLLEIGNGKVPRVSDPDNIAIPRGLGKVINTLEELKAEVYPCLATNAVRTEWLAERAILSPLNTNVNQLNDWLMRAFPGEEKVYKSVDTALCEEDAVNYPVELLNSLELSGMPPHILHLKIGVPVMILRNLEPPKTANGTRCIITRLHTNVIEAAISCGPYRGEVVLLPRIPLIPSDSELPFQFRRLQFPCKPCFAMTINKAQGQTFAAIGIDLSVPCFSHGQLYVAASRVGTSAKLSIKAPNGITRNVVYPECLEM